MTRREPTAGGPAERRRARALLAVATLASLALHGAILGALALLPRSSPAPQLPRTIAVDLISVPASEPPVPAGTAASDQDVGAPRGAAGASTRKPARSGEAQRRAARAAPEAPPAPPAEVPAPLVVGDAETARGAPAEPATPRLAGADEPRGAGGEGVSGAEAGSASAPGGAAGAGSYEGGTGGGGGAIDGGSSAGRRGGAVDAAAIRARIARALRYPDEARRMGWRGRVLVRFTLRADGSVDSPQVVQSSGVPALDQAAIAAVRQAAPFPAPGGEVALSVPVAFER